MKDNEEKTDVASLLGKLLKPQAGLLIIIIAAVLIELTSTVQFLFARKEIRVEVESRAQSELHTTGLEVEKVMTAIEAGISNNVWAIEQTLDRPDAMFDIISRIVGNNEDLVGCSLAFRENYYAGKGQYYEPYAHRVGDNIKRKQIGSDNHRYVNSDWFKTVIATDEPYWSEPYFDESGGETMMITYGVPIHDKTGQVVAVLGGDVSLDWLGNTLNAHPIYPSSFNVMISRQGIVIASPADKHIQEKNVDEISAHIGGNNKSTKQLNESMMAGESGHIEVTDSHDEKYYVFYAPVGGDVGWSMAVVCTDSEIFHNLHQVVLFLSILMLIGLALLGYIVWRTARSYNRARQATAEKERIGSELRIARNIQLAMLPKTFPPYPERSDIDLFGTLTSAKEVGGDLYDFHVRDEKLFFCIGDVSGKGVPASLVMAVTRALFRNISAHETSPESILSQLNDTMTQGNDANMFVTLFVGVLDLTTGLLCYANAGHNAPIIVTADNNQTTQLSVDANLPVGIMPGYVFTAQEAMIDSGTTIFLYTDGLTEAENITHELFGLERVRAVLNGTLAPRELIEQVIRSVHTFVDGAEQSDDLTMLAVKRMQPSSAVQWQSSITLANDVLQVTQLGEWIHEIGNTLELDQAIVMKINLAVEEAVVNVMKYAYPAGGKGEVRIEVNADKTTIGFTITDNGLPFDPTTVGEVDTMLPVEERPVGGLGVHLIRQIMDGVTYERTESTNVLRMTMKY